MPFETRPRPAPQEAVDFAELFAGLPTAYLVMTPDFVIVEANNAYLAMSGRSREQLIGKFVFDAFPPGPQAQGKSGPNTLRLSFEQARKAGKPQALPLYRYDIVDEATGATAERYWSVITAPLHRSDGTVSLVVERVEDVTDYVRERERILDGISPDQQWERRVEAAEADLYLRMQELRAAQEAREAAVEALLVSEQRARAILDAAADGIITIDGQGVMESVNVAAELMFGYAASEMIGRDIDLLVPEPDPSRHNGLLMRHRPTGDEVMIGSRHESVGQRSDGSTFPIELAVSEVGPTRQLFTVVVRDISDRKQLEEQLTAQALHDPLTGLANRTLLVNRLDHALARRARHSGVLGLFFIDLDRFKLVNDTLGHDAGDELLVQTATRISQAVRPEDLVARMGGDEFVVLCEDLASPADAESVARRVVEVLSAPLHLRGREIYVSASVGLVTDTGERTSSELLGDADAAMYQAKQQGRGRHSVLDDTARAVTTDRLHLTSELHRALERSELHLCYQPMIDMSSGEVLAAEALLRWQNAQRGVLPPNDFLPLADDIGLIADFDAWVLATACADTADWCRQLGRPVGVWINLSSRSLADRRLPETLVHALEQSELDPRLLTLEITEGALMQNASATVRTLSALREIGVHLAVDDFGTGYSSLSYLQQFPVHALKVDRSFVGRLDESASDAQASAAIIRAIVSLAAGLDLQTVAEGIETPDQLAAVTELGCDLGQGYFLGRPAAREDIVIAAPHGVMLPSAFASAVADL